MELEQVLHRENLNRAWRRVVSNGGAPGVDGMPVEALKAYLTEHGPRIREGLTSGTYEPQPVRRVEIPKPDGKGTRMLGIPTVLDRFIQQAILQVLTPQVDPPLQSEQLRVSAGQERARRAQGGPGARGSGLRLGGGHRPGEVL